MTIFDRIALYGSAIILFTTFIYGIIIGIMEKTKPLSTRSGKCEESSHVFRADVHCGF